MTPKLILASESPRRRELLKKAGYNFDVVPSKVSETPDKNLNVHDQILDIARRKARATLAQIQSQTSEAVVVLSADTEVIFANQPLGKPQNENDAHRILRLLSGTVHEVVTAVCVIDGVSKKEYSQYETTQVHFKELSDEEIKSYIKTGEPMDKAGAYGIQGLGKDFVLRYDGPYDNIVGLPIDLTKKLLSSFVLTNS